MSDRVLVSGLGDFGRDVADLLGAMGPRYEIVHVEKLDAGDYGDTSGLIVAAWRPSRSLFERVDEVAHRNGHSWIPVVMNYPYMRIGPWIVPGKSGCYRCYERRQAQHGAESGITAALQAAYERDGECGPKGHLPHHARIAAALAARCAAGASAPGSVFTMNVLKGTMGRHHLVSCHGCRRCDALPPDIGSDHLPRLIPLPADAGRSVR